MSAAAAAAAAGLRWQPALTALPARRMLHKLSQELMILGFLSFSLVMSNEYNAPWIPNPDWFHALEFGTPPQPARPLPPAHSDSR